MAVGVADLEAVITAFNVTKLPHPLYKSAEIPVGPRSGATNRNHHQGPARRTLRERRERARGYRAAEQRDELAPPHSITSSAIARMPGGITKPSPFAVLR